MGKKASIPERTCCGCRKVKAKSDLLAITRLKDGSIIVQYDGKIAGRSAHLCRSKICLEKVYKGKRTDALSISLKRKISPDIREKIEELITKR